MLQHWYVTNKAAMNMVEQVFFFVVVVFVFLWDGRSSFGYMSGVVQLVLEVDQFPTLWETAKLISIVAA